MKKKIKIHLTQDTTDSLLIQAIEKQNDSINAIATKSLKFGNKPAETTTYQKLSRNTDFHQQMDRLTELCKA